MPGHRLRDSCRYASCVSNAKPRPQARVRVGVVRPAESGGLGVHAGGTAAFRRCADAVSGRCREGRLPADRRGCSGEQTGVCVHAAETSWTKLRRTVRSATAHALHRQVLTGIYVSGKSAHSPFRVAGAVRRGHVRRVPLSRDSSTLMCGSEPELGPCGRPAPGVSASKRSGAAERRVEGVRGATRARRRRARANSPTTR